MTLQNTSRRSTLKSLIITTLTAGALALPSLSAVAQAVTTPCDPQFMQAMESRAWLEAHKVPYAFHDYKKAGIDKARLEGWVKQAGWETVLNRAGLTFKKLPDADKADLTEKKAVALMLARASAALVTGDLELVKNICGVRSAQEEADEEAAAGERMVRGDAA